MLQNHYPIGHRPPLDSRSRVLRVLKLLCGAHPPATMRSKLSLDCRTKIKGVTTQRHKNIGGHGEKGKGHEKPCSKRMTIPLVKYSDSICMTLHPSTADRPMERLYKSVSKINTSLPRLWAVTKRGPRRNIRGRWHHLVKVGSHPPSEWEGEDPGYCLVHQRVPCLHQGIDLKLW